MELQKNCNNKKVFKNVRQIQLCKNSYANFPKALNLRKVKFYFQNLSAVEKKKLPSMIAFSSESEP